jgi:type IV pilus assembly protein PilP
MKLKGWSGGLRGRAGLMTLMAPVWLIGCTEADPTDLRVWMQNQRALHAPQVQTVPAAVDAHVPVYQHPQGVQPFSAERLHLTARKGPAEADVAQRLRPMPTQNRPPLDVLPLAGMRLVGSVQRGAETLAMLRVRGLIYAVRIGDRIGQDQGRVSAITLSGLVLHEVVPNAVGQQTERIVSMALVPEP